MLILLWQITSTPDPGGPEDALYVSNILDNSQAVYIADLTEDPAISYSTRQSRGKTEYTKLGPR